MAHYWTLTGASERGSALLTGLSLIMVLSLLGVAAFEVATIEANLVTRDQWQLQAFYCAEAQAARIYNLYDLGCPVNACKNPLGDVSGNLRIPPGDPRLGPTTLTLANGSFTFSATVDDATPTVTVIATCTLPSGTSRTVRRSGTRDFWPYQYALVSAGYNPGTGALDLLGDLFFGGTGVPVNPPGGTSYVLGADTINGRIYAAGNVLLNGAAAVNPYSASDPGPRITVYPGRSVYDYSSAFDSGAAGAVLQSTLDPMPSLSNSQRTGAIDKIQALVDPPGGTPSMKATYNGAAVYNLTEIFRQLGQTSEGNAERNLARPASCTFGQPSTDAKCQVWQDLVLIGPRQTCLTAASCASGVIGPTDKPSYFFMGLPRVNTQAPQQTSFDVIFAAAVNASAEMRQLGFVATSYTSLGQRLDGLLGTNIDGEGKANRLVELTVGMDPVTAQGVIRPTPPIFYVDGYWRADGGTSFGYNGVATVVATKSMILSDNLLYLGGISNVNTTLAASTGCPNDGTHCGLADMLGLMAKEDVWMGDSNGTVHEISAVVLAGRDFNYFDYTSSGQCCQGPSNPTTFNGSVLATRQASLVRDWAYPNSDRLGPEQQCNDAGGSVKCRPVAFYTTQPADANGNRPAWCSNPNAGNVAGCWVFMAMNTSTGRLDVDATKAAFNDGCVTTSLSPLAPATCPAGARRIAHFQLNVNYDTRLVTHGNILPTALPGGGTNAYRGLINTTWKDCGPNNPSCR